MTNPQISSVSDYDGAYGSVDLKHHRYEVSYKKTKIGKDPVFVVKNRRIAQIDIDVEKRWNDGSGALRDAMKNALDIYNAQHTDTSLELSMYLDFDDPAGTASGGQITRKAGNEGDTILVDGHNVETIYDSDRRESAKSVQTMSLESHQNDGSVIRSDHYAFYGVPKYNAKGQVIRYQVKEAWVTKVTEEGTPVYQKVSDVSRSLRQSRLRILLPVRQNPICGISGVHISGPLRKHIRLRWMHRKIRRLRAMTIRLSPLATAFPESRRFIGKNNGMMHIPENRIPARIFI